MWYEDTILVINPVTGIVEKEYGKYQCSNESIYGCARVSCFVDTTTDFRQLYPLTQRNKDRADVLNGISVSADPDILYVTGKKWDRMFKIKLL